MSQYNKANYKALYGSTGTVFPDNTTEDISEGDMRQFGEDQADTFMSISDNAYNMFGATASGTDTYTATLSPSISSYSSDHRYFIKFTNANTGAATLNLNSIGAKSIVKNGSTALSAADIKAGQILILAYDGTNLQIVGNVSSGGGISGLTANRIPYAISSTALTDDSALTWDATNNAVTIGSARMHSPGTSNTFIGESSGNFTLTGNTNTGVGHNSLQDLTSGNNNTTFGQNAGRNITSGSANIAVGVGALDAVTTASGNTAVGNGSGFLATGSSNIFIGQDCGDNVTSGGQNIIIGAQVDAPSATNNGQLIIQNIIFGTGNTNAGTTISTGSIGIGIASPATKLDVDGPVRVKSYTVAGVPSASGVTGAMIYVSNESGGAVIAFSDGTNWRRVTDRNIIS